MPVVPSSPAESTSALSQSQRLIWAGQRLAPDAPLYNMAFRLDLHGAIDPDRFHRAFQTLVDRSDALRTRFHERDGTPLQSVLPRLIYQVELVDLSARSDPGAACSAWVEARSRRCLDLSECSFDSVLLKLAPEHFVWFLNQHHLTEDAWTATLIQRKVAAIYAALGGAPSDPSEPFPAFADFLAYERSLRNSEAHQAARAHWRQDAANPMPRIELYGRRARERGFRTERLVRPLGTDRSERLRQFAMSPGVRSLSVQLSLFKIFAAVLFAYLHRVGNSSAPVIGVPAHNRSSQAFRETIGIFVELFPLRAGIEYGETFRSLLDRVGEASQVFLRHALPGAGTIEGAKQFNVVLNFIHASFGPFDDIPVEPEWIHPGHGDPAHDLRLQIHDFAGKGELIVCFDFHESVFEPALRPRAADHFLRLLDVCHADPDRPIGQIPLTGKQEQQALLERFDQTPTPPAYESIPALFRRQARLTPGAPALEQGAAVMSYGELDQRSERLAGLLRGRGVGPGSLIGLYLERSFDLVLAILAVHKSGAAYVPLESRLPEARVAYILLDTDAALVLTSRALAARLPEGTPSLTLDGAWDEDLAGDTDLVDPAPGETAYIIYTSGSTGNPKGVVIDHGGLSAYVRWAHTSFAGGEPASFPLYSSIGFDLTVTSIFVPLICGGAIVVYPERGSGADLAVLQVFDDDRVDLVKLTPAHLALVTERAAHRSRIKALILGGEDLKSAQVRRICASGQRPLSVFNEYGPTEAVVGCMIHRFDPELDQAASVPIGKPAAGVRIHVLDQGLNPVPEGVVGEIHIGGERLARGYLHRDDLTAQRFIDDPWCPGGRLYRSGDLGRLDANCNLEYLGRADAQLKVRGVRIEPAEIEQALSEHPRVRESALALTRFERRPESSDAHHCSRCGLSSAYPGADIDASGVCVICRDFDAYRDRADIYFSDIAELYRILAQARAERAGDYDCILLLSGGKDSTYALYRMAEISQNILALTLDNGFISDGAKANIARVVESLGVDHRYVATEAMNAIFVDSLHRHSNVCHGCFKTIYTLALRLAREEHIPLIVTGLSRGQFFETRLTPELLQRPGLRAEDIECTVLDARKAYHRIEDAVHRLLDTRMFEDDAIFEQVRFVDFYRYCDVSLEQVYAYLGEHAPWIRPSDTGRSTNCLINDVGIHVHKRRRGFHNYALPYSWDVRLGHKQRDAALEELDDRIDERRVQEILDEIGYQEDLDALHDEQLTAYFTADVPLAPEELRAFLTARLPAAMIPGGFMQLEEIPLTGNGKLDAEALPVPSRSRPSAGAVYRAPSTALERQLAGIWCSVLEIESVGIDDNFYDLGGDSLAAIRIAAKADAVGLSLAPTAVFEHQTLSTLAALIDVCDRRAVPPLAATVPPAASAATGLDVKTKARLAALFGNRSND